MSDWYDQFNSVFFITITTITLGVISLSVKYCLKSKCDQFECCCLKIHRNTNQEARELGETEPTLGDIYSSGTELFNMGKNIYKKVEEQKHLEENV